MPNDSELGCVAWDRSDGWVCCGGAAGLVRVLRLEPPDPETGKASISTFVLGGHLEKGSKVNACRWNEKHRKLTTCDDAGLIIVWVLHKGQWHEEMLNNRQKSTVSDLRWAPDASKICIAYQVRLWTASLMPLRASRFVRGMRDSAGEVQSSECPAMQGAGSAHCASRSCHTITVQFPNHARHTCPGSVRRVLSKQGRTWG